MDRLYRGFIAGAIAGILLNAINLSCFYIFKITEIRFIDWTSILAFGYRPENLNGILLNLFFQLLWDGFLGVIFAFLIPHVTSRAYLIKGVLYGSFLTFVFRAVAVLFRLPFLINKFPLMTHEVNLLAVFIWGLTLAFILKKLDQLPLVR